MCDEQVAYSVHLLRTIPMQKCKKKSTHVQVMFNLTLAQAGFQAPDDLHDGADYLITTAGIEEIIGAPPE